MKHWFRNGIIILLMAVSASAGAKDASLKGQLLQDAIADRNEDVLHLLLKQGANVNDRLPNGAFPILYAAEMADVETMELLTASKADVLVRAEGGVSAMHLAAASGDIQKIKLLRALKVPADIQDDSGLTPLYLAWMSGQIKVADYLIESEKAHVNVNDTAGVPLAFRVVSQSDNPKVMEHMIKHKLNIFARNKTNKSLLDIAQTRKFDKTAAILQQKINEKLKAYQDKLNKQQTQ